MSKKALVVDNDFFFVEFLSDLLETRGYEVKKAYDGKEGISKLKEGPVDILFVDMIMPKIDGKQFITFTRKTFPDARFPIVMISATLTEQMELIDEVDADFCVAKGPIDAMAGTINEFMDKLEKNSFQATHEHNFLEPGRVHPRQSTSELLDKLDYEQAILQSIGIGIVVVDKDARIIKANSSALSIIDRPFEEVVDHHVTTIFAHNGQRRDLVGAMKKAIQDQALTRITCFVLLGSQSVRVVVSVLKVRDDIVGWIIALEDEMP